MGNANTYGYDIRHFLQHPPPLPSWRQCKSFCSYLLVTIITQLKVYYTRHFPLQMSFSHSPLLSLWPVFTLCLSCVLRYRCALNRIAVDGRTVRKVWHLHKLGSAACCCRIYPVKTGQTEMKFLKQFCSERWWIIGWVCVGMDSCVLGSKLMVFNSTTLKITKRHYEREQRWWTVRLDYGIVMVVNWSTIYLSFKYCNLIY